MSVRYGDVFFVMIRRPPRSSLFPSTSLFRAGREARAAAGSGLSPFAPRPSPLAPRSEPAGETEQPHGAGEGQRSEEHTSEPQSRQYLVSRLLLVKTVREPSSSIVFSFYHDNT